MHAKTDGRTLGWLAFLQRQTVTPAWVHFALKMLVAQVDILISVPLAVQLITSFQNIIDPLWAGRAGSSQSTVDAQVVTENQETSAKQTEIARMECLVIALQTFAKRIRPLRQEL